MKTENAGKQIKILREKEKISKSKLCRGLCTVQNLLLIEEGEGMADMLLLISLFERLGRSAEGSAYILTAEEYQRLMRRDRIGEALRFGKISEAKKLFEAYRKENPPGKNRILRMYEERICGILALEEGAKETGESAAAKREEAAAHFMAAVQWTISCEGQFGDALTRALNEKKILLSMIEIGNILLYLYVQQMMGKREGQIELLEALYQYLKDNMQDKELRAQYSAKLGMLLGARYLEKENYHACAMLHEEILQWNRECGMVVCVLPILEQIIAAYKALREAEKIRFYTVHKENLEVIFRRSKVSLEYVNKLYYTRCSRQYFLEGEIIAAERKWKGISQEELVEGIYQNKENLSRIETGKANSDRKKFYQLMERLGLDKTRYNGDLTTDEYWLLMLEQDIERHIAQKQKKELADELYLLEASVDMGEKSNQQFVLGTKNIELYYNGEIGVEEAIEKAKALLELTYHLDNMEKGGQQYRRIPFRNEMYLFNQICILLRISGRIEEAIEMMERMMRTYDAAKEDKKFHFGNTHLCATNLCQYLEIANRLEDAERIADRLIREELVHGKIILMRRLFATKFDVLEKRGLAMTEGKEYLQRAHLLSVWCCYEKDCARLKEVMEGLGVPELQ